MSDLRLASVDPDVLVQQFRQELARSRRIDRFLSGLSGILSVGVAVLAFYWLIFGGGVASAFPEYHRLMVSLLLHLPDQADHVQSLINCQGYLSLWQIQEITEQLTTTNGHTN